MTHDDLYVRLKRKREHLIRLKQKRAVALHMMKHHKRSGNQCSYERVRREYYRLTDTINLIEGGPHV